MNRRIGKHTVAKHGETFHQDTQIEGKTVLWVSLILLVLLLLIDEIEKVNLSSFTAKPLSKTKGKAQRRITWRFSNRPFFD
jgi:hypothetical protein